MNRKSFTLIELLIVLSILALIVGLLISIIKPAEIYKKTRDNQRIVDLNYLDSNIKSYLLLANQSTIYTTSTLNKIFLSLKLPSSATNTDCRNYFPDLPSLPSGWTYVCSKNPTSTDGTGWLPINFQNYMLYSISNLPLDPFNNSIYYYAFIASGTDFILYAMLEDPKNQASKNDGDNYPHLYSVGTNKRLIDQAQGLVGYWPFDEGTGTIAYDYSGNGNNGTLVNFNFTATSGWTTGKVGGALSFDGVDDYSRIPDSNSLDVSSSFTFSVWVYTTNSGILQTILSKDGVGSDTTGAYNLYIRSDLSVFYETNNIDGVYTTANVVSLNRWYYITVTFDNNISPKLKIYINGQKLQEGNPSTPYILTTDLLIGRRGIGSFFQGVIDEVRIYNRALSDSEIKALYDATK
jgi:type II secretory pathway pseudopilin PulG